MSENIPPEPTNGPKPTPPPADWRDQRAQWREDRRNARERWREERRAGRGYGGGAWIGGAILVALGVIFLVQNLTGFELRNWWALFILLPAIGTLGNAINQYQAAGGHLNASARGSLVAGLVLTLIAVAFLVGINNLFWPILLIILGLGLLLNVFLPG